MDVSQRNNTKLHAVATRLTATTTGEPLPDAVRAALRGALARKGLTPL